MLDRLKKLALGLAALAALAGGGAVIAGADGGKGDDRARAEKSAQERADDGDRDHANGRDEQGEDKNKGKDEDKNEGKDEDKNEDKGARSSDDESDRKPSSGATGRAKQAALASTGGGKVNSVELDNEKRAKYEVEVTKPDGSTVDVRLSGDFKVVATDADSGG